MVSPLQAYFLPSHENGEASVLEKLPQGSFPKTVRCWNSWDPQ
jgi:hypothetical protein